MRVELNFAENVAWNKIQEIYIYIFCIYIYQRRNLISFREINTNLAHNLYSYVLEKQQFKFFFFVTKNSTKITKSIMLFTFPKYQTNSPNISLGIHGNI